ncbi:MAG: hypothetical protein LC751_19185 [Actinobacteria bacterium]|nr:hypothetical protein [Actinomycetota bacterium]
MLQKDWEVAQTYQVAGTPSAVIVQPDGTIDSPVAGGSEAIEALVTHVVEGKASAQLPIYPQTQGELCPYCGKVHPPDHAAEQTLLAGPKLGEPAPPTKLPDLRGETVELKDFGAEKRLEAIS